MIPVCKAITMQLNLFEWDMIEAGRGRESLAGLDFVEARRRFLKVLGVRPEHPEASQGLRDLRFWEEVFRRLGKMDPATAAVFLWNRISGFHFTPSESSRNLRLTLLRHLITLVDESPSLYIPPDLCRGFLHLQLGDYAAAETGLGLLLEENPDNGRLRAYLADALWMQGKKKAAAEMYAVALLSSSRNVNTAALRDGRLAELIQEYGPGLAPVYGYMTGTLPLVIPPGEAVSPEARVYGHLFEAEKFRRLNEHQAMVTARRHFKELEPAVFQDYLEWLATGEAAW